MSFELGVLKFMYHKFVFVGQTMDFDQLTCHVLWVLNMRTCQLLRETETKARGLGGNACSTVALL